MISGKYIGELARLAMKSLIKDRLLFGGKSSAAFDKFEEFGTQYVSMIEDGYVVLVEQRVGYPNTWNRWH